MTLRPKLAQAVLCIAILGVLAPAAVLADSSVCDAIAGNIVKNCGFETGNFSGWVVNPAGPDSSDVGVIAGNQHSGIYHAYFGAINEQYDAISQTLSTHPGTGYTVSFWLNNYSGTSDADFKAFWDGTLLVDVPGTSAFPYTDYVFSVHGAGSDTLRFEGYQGITIYRLDDVSVVAPEPSGLYLLGLYLLCIGLLGLGSLVPRKLSA